MQAQISEQVGLLYLSGIIHRETSNQVTGLFNKLLEEGAPIIILSFQNVKALLSDGIRQMIALSDSARKQGREFYITDLPREVKYTLQITNLLELLGHAGNTAGLLQQKSIDKAALNTVAMEVAASESTRIKSEPQKETPAAPAPTTPPAAKPKHDPANATSRLKAIGTREASAAAEPKDSPQEKGIGEIRTAKEMVQFIINYIPGEAELQIVAMMLKDPESPVDLDTMEEEIDFELLQIKEALRRMMRRQTIDALGNGVFKLASIENLLNAAKKLLLHYETPNTRGKILQLLHKAEQLPS